MGQGQPLEDGQCLCTSTASYWHRRLSRLKRNVWAPTERVREAIRAPVEKILMEENGSLTLELKPKGLLGTQTAIAESGGRGTAPMLERTF